MTTTTRSRVWTVRMGGTGTGLDLFQVYAPTMEEARASVDQIQVQAPYTWMSALVGAGFTVHAGVEFDPCPIIAHLIATTPAIDLDTDPAPVPEIPPLYVRDCACGTGLTMADNDCTCLFQGTTRLQDPACPLHGEDAPAGIA